MEVKLEQVVSAIEQASDAYTMFLDMETGETVYLPDRFETGVSDEELEELLEEEPGRFLRFPTKCEIYEYGIMEGFIEQLSPCQARGELADAIRGKGAFRRFKDTLRYHGLDRQWYAFWDNAIREIAVRWCMDNGVSVQAEE